MKIIPLIKDMHDIVVDIVSSYETRIDSIQSIFETNHQIFEGFQDSFFDTKREIEKVNTELRDRFARYGSLRKRDFDTMMQGILSSQDKKEKEVRNLLNNYIHEQKDMINSLRDNFSKIRHALDQGEVERIKESQEMIKRIFTKQEERKKEVTSKLETFQKGQQEMAKRLKNLLTKGREIRLNDLKSLLEEFKAQQKERIVHRQERRKQVIGMLGKFKKERIEAKA